MTHRPHPLATRGRAPACGAATVPLVVVVALLLLLLAGLVQGRLATAQRLAAAQVHAARADSAAEAGVAWLLAHLNSGTRVDDRCEPADGGRSLASRLAGRPDGAGRWSPPDGSAGCAHRADSGWACQCARPAGLPGAPAPGPGPATGSAVGSGSGSGAGSASGGTGSGEVTFAVALHAAPRGDLLHLVAHGCSGGVAPCAAGDGDGRARVSVTVARLPALRHAPAAALTVPGRLGLGVAAWTLTAGPGASLALHTGGPVAATRLTLAGPTGTPRAALQVLGDTSLHVPAAAAARFAAQFQLPPADWQTLPAVWRIDCRAPCDGPVQAALRSDASPVLWLQGGLRLAGPVALGTADRPVLVVADGPVDVGAPATLHGLLHLRAPDWRSPAGFAVTGAVTAEGDLEAHGPATVRHAPAVLQALARGAGRVLRVPGSWRDFE